MDKIKKETLAGQLEGLYIAWKAFIRSVRRSNFTILLLVIELILLIIFVVKLYEFR